MLKNYVLGTLGLIAIIWGCLAFFALFLFEWSGWMTMDGLFYTGFAIVMGSLAYLFREKE